MPRHGKRMENVIVRLPADMLHTLKELAARRGVKPGTLHRDLLAEALNRERAAGWVLPAGATSENAPGPAG